VRRGQWTVAGRITTDQVIILEIEDPEELLGPGTPKVRAEFRLKSALRNRIEEIQLLIPC